MKKKSPQSSDPQALVRPLVRELHPYTPGEQPKIKGLIKLNTNENPYGPAPAVLKAVKNATDERLRLYPNPTSQALRENIAALHRCAPENVFVGNGSDEVLALAVRAFVEPLSATSGSRATVQYFSPSYSLYPVLAATHGTRINPVALKPDFDLPNLERCKSWDQNAALTLITTPNAPSGRGYTRRQLEKICRGQTGAVLLDEAYVDFAREDALPLALKYPHVLAARTFSKAYSLCYLRVGYCVGHPVLIEALDRIRDSYNVNGLGQVAALATLKNLPYYRRNFARIVQTRDRLTDHLAKLGFRVLPSETNFILARPPVGAAEEWLQALRDRKVLVRWFSAPELKDWLRITIGSPGEIGTLLRASKEILAELR